jgi:hypothetical protein
MNAKSRGLGRAAAVGLAAFFFSGIASATPEDFFEQKIRPVLAEQCYGCHSTATDALKGDLLLDSAEGIAKGGASGLPAVIPADANSRLLAAIRRESEDLQMPPKKALPAQVIADFEQWIRDGAVFPASDIPIDLMAKAKQHWAFHPPASQALPPVFDVTWPKTEVDHFVLARLEAAGLAPSPEADRRTIIRRLSFDLLGLPPAPDEVAAFVNDPDPEAYSKLVERYLASPHYGERWARHWLDVARYADTKGYVYGREEFNFTHSHVYRDWVVRAFNNDMPYDEFVRLQLAADTLTDESRREDLAAMGFLTLGQRYLGVKPDIIDDRIDTVTRGLMGLTVSCARCHDHKFDPVPTADYYSLYGVFSASSERLLPLDPDYAAVEKYKAFTEEMNKRKAKLAETFAAKTEVLETRLRSQVDRYLEAVPTADSLPTDDFYEILNEDDLNPTIVRRWAAYIARKGPDDPIFGPWNRLAALPEKDFNLNAYSLVAGLRKRKTYGPTGVNKAIANELGVMSAFIDFNQFVSRYARLFKQIDDRWLELVAKAKEKGEATPAALPDPDWEAIRQVMMAPDSPIQVQDGAIIDLEWMFAEPARVELAKLQAEIDRWIIKAEASPAHAVILADKPEAAQPRIFGRGNPANPGPFVERQFLELLSGAERKPFADGSGRREMADAIAQADNPLTARVFVNRVWGWHFGTGLVDTPSDFGTRSAPPSHPALLDWLAIQFVDNGWSLKDLHRQVVLSATYRQSSLAPDEDARVTKARGVDPENRLLWRFNRYRLGFESMRDALLTASTELDRALGGRPVKLVAKPYPVRRTIYGRVDRRFLPSIFRVFDFPNPDMHSPTRPITTVPQQALYLMNNEFIQGRARALAAAAVEAAPTADAARVNWIYRQAYQRDGTPEQVARALAFVEDAVPYEMPPPPEVEPTDWSYGYGKMDIAKGVVENFTALPHYTGAAYQGGANWPDAKLGWVQLTAEGGHPGNTLDHAAVRRWTSPVSGKVTIAGRITHEPLDGDGIMARVISSRHGVLGAWSLHANETDAIFYGITVEPGDTLDFEVDIKGGLNSDQYLWAPKVTFEASREGEAVARVWDAKAEFGPPVEAVIPPAPLTAWEKYAQVVLASNEFLFVD